MLRLRQDAELTSIDPGQQREGQKLDAEDHREAGGNKRQQVQPYAGNFQRTADQGGNADKARAEQGRARHTEQPFRAMQQKEAEMAPAIAPCAQVRGP